jgi:hypothetical protein
VNDVDMNGFQKIRSKNPEFALSVKVRIGIGLVKSPRNNDISYHFLGAMT